MTENMPAEILAGKSVLNFQNLEHGICSLTLSDNDHPTLEFLGRFVGTSDAMGRLHSDISVTDFSSVFGRTR